jgi:hypothetical protein
MKDRHIAFYTVSFFIVTTALFLAGCKKSGEPNAGSINTFKRYPYERYHLAYEYSGDLRGTEELFVADFGKYEARYSKFDIMSPETIRHMDNSSITRISDLYILDYSEKSVINERLGTLDSLYHLDESDIPSAQAYLESEMKKNFMKNAGIEILGGKPATHWQGMEAGVDIWVWNTLMLRKEAVSLNGRVELTIKSIDTLWTVDTTKFSVPAGFTKKEKPNRNNAPPAN